MAFEPIENYGVIGNMQSIALVGMNGSIDFLCYPNFDSPTVFAALLDDEKGGRFEIRPKLSNMRVRQLYLPETNILVTRFLAEEGVAELTDFMPIEQDGAQPAGGVALRVHWGGRGRRAGPCGALYAMRRADEAMGSADVEPLFAPISVRGLALPNRIVMAPMTRNFSPGGVPGDDVAAYY